VNGDLSYLEDIFAASAGCAESDEEDVFALLIDEHEKKNYQFNPSQIRFKIFDFL
jgi:hypothetical protein